ncbi:M1 family aminopeptidase [Mucilaginibacter sp. SG564]|uniref:ABC transporter permease/M1 family aminopeptidase n=1 Tax=Mucilaginibacter sp. SG564 TaxID=2587022 RepID=UPI0015527031|nr:M1 family aminopeptidase [Mucilaginibacter sp. SG564]NOW96472.1 hypothetical protein [Mucilaginibacter sp. SG564]
MPKPDPVMALSAEGQIWKMFILLNSIILSNMFTALLKFDWLFFARKISFYLVLVLFAALGLVTAAAANFPFQDTFKNSPYVITYIAGIASLLSIFTVTLLAAQSLLREKDSQFDLILYATPINKLAYLTSRMTVIFMVATFSFALFMAGLLLGHQLFRSYTDQYTGFQLWSYAHPFLTLAVPNILFCTGIICSIGAIAKNKMIIYISGLFIYFLYWGISLFTNSPLMANASPVSAQSMQLMARLDPFGMAAFFEQTQYWSAAQRNSQVLALRDNFLFNRVFYTFISGIFIIFAYRKLNFTLSGTKTVSRKQCAAPPQTPTIRYQPLRTQISGSHYLIKAWYSFVKRNLSFVVKSIPFWLLILGWGCFLSMELYGDIAGGSRFPEKFATSALMISNILEVFPIVGLLAVIFYGSEIFWYSQSTRFDALENSSPVPPSIVLMARWCTLSAVLLLLIASNMVIGILFQLLFACPHIDWQLYLSLFYLTGLPLSFSAALVVSIQVFCKNRYKGLAVSTLLLLILNTSLGGLIGLKNPLLLFANVYHGEYSEMNGFDLLLNAFHYKTLYGIFVTAGILMIAIKVWESFQKWYKIKLAPLVLLSICVAGAFISGYVISNQTVIKRKNERNDWKQVYEKKYKKYRDTPQPTIIAVNTDIDLYPENNSYIVKGTYTLVNKSREDIDRVLLYTDKDLQWKAIKIPNAEKASNDAAYGHVWYFLKQPLKPGGSMNMTFSFSYQASAFNGFMQFSAILKNGSFLRISNFYPRFGYMADNEIDDPIERKHRKLPASDVVKPLDAACDSPYNYGYINLNATISTSKEQMAVGIGELKASWHKAARSYYQYQTTQPVPFRFAVASAQYNVLRTRHHGIAVEAYYQSGHQQNIGRLMDDAKQAIDYCEENFGKYPYRTIRFAEISSFTKGFAATAYPTAFFINEDFGFQNKIEHDARRDILNEQISHELSHTWWGNAMIDPEYRQGSKVLTETLAMYTELMLYKKKYGTDNLLSRIKVHKDIYLGKRGFDDEEPLYKADPKKSYLCYDKGMVVMYQLYLLLGESKINQALKNFLNKYTYPNQPPTSLDLINELYAVANKIQQAKIDELFKHIVTYDIQLYKVALSLQRSGHYNLSFNLVSNKYSEDDHGKKLNLPLNGEVELEIEFENGKRQMFAIHNSSGNKLLNLKERPVRITADPKMKFLDVNMENNTSVIK